MKFAAWNVRGFNNPRRRIEVLKFCRLKNFDVVGILESKIPCECLSTYMKPFEMDWDWTFSERSGRVRILVLWKRTSVSVFGLHIHDQCINCEFGTSHNGVKMQVTFVYADNWEPKRNSLWSMLESYVPSLPWLILGDFNATISKDERKGRRCIKRVEKGLLACCKKHKLSDLPSSGCLFTWLNRRKGLNAIKAKLDRALTSPDWLHVFPDSKAHFYEPRTSDHSCVEVTTSHCYPSRPKPFHFFTCWTQHSNFSDIVKTVWSL